MKRLLDLLDRVIGDGSDLAFVMGLGAIVYGLWIASVVAGLIALGISLLVLSKALSLRNRKQQ